MAKLIYSAIASLDGYIEDAEGRFDWAAPSDEVHIFVNELERAVGMYLYGRQMYETMLFWEKPPALAQQPPAPLAEPPQMELATPHPVFAALAIGVPTSARTVFRRRTRPLRQAGEADLLSNKEGARRLVRFMYPW